MSAYLRPWQIDDAEALLNAARTSPDLRHQFGKVESDGDATRVIKTYQSRVEAGTGYVWAIVDEGAPIGCIGVTAIERRHRTAWCWYWLDTAARGRGLASRALATAANHAFQDGLFRLELGHRVNNPASRAVAVRAGFQSEGIERAKLEYDGVRHDCETHARLADDPAPHIELLPVAN